jgi:hypothetical protein
LYDSPERLEGLTMPSEKATGPGLAVEAEGLFRTGQGKDRDGCPFVGRYGLGEVQDDGLKIEAIQVEVRILIRSGSVKLDSAVSNDLDCHQ